MPAHKLGPGRLTFGETGTPSEWGAQVTAAALEPEVDEGDELLFLDGSEDSEETESYNITGTVAQSYDASSLLIWAHEHRGQVLPFTFKPRDDQALTVTGQAKIRALKIGGDVKTKNTSDFTFPGVGDYDLATTTEPDPGP